VSDAAAHAPLLLLDLLVRPDWIDYNGHMNDAAYAVAFSEGIEAFLVWLGFDADYRARVHVTVYTLEAHIRYLQEAGEGDAVAIDLRLLDCDAKRLHVYLRMLAEDGTELATSEQMLMAIDTETGRSAPFRAPVSEQVESLWAAHESLPRPDPVGHPMGIRRR